MGIVLTTKGLDTAVRNLEVLKKDLDSTLLEIVEAGTLSVHERVKNLATTKLRVRTGRYRASITRKVVKSNRTGIVGTKLVYARMIEKGTSGLPGGVLRPRRKKWLTIPAKAAQTRAGVSKPITDYNITRWIPIPANNPTRILAIGMKGGSEKLLFILVKKVKIEGKKIFETAYRDEKEKVRRDAHRRISRLVSHYA